MELGSESAGLRTGEVRPDAPFETHLGRVLSRLARARATGVLEIDAGRLRTTFYLHEGTVVFADAGTVGETLGRVLVRQGALEPHHYAAILRRMTEALVDDEVMRFGEVGVELGLLTADEVSSALTRQVHEKLVRCLELDELHWVFRADAEAVARVARYPSSLVGATFEATLSPEDAGTWELRLARLGGRALVLRPEAKELGIPPDALRLARLFDGSRSVADVLARSDRGAERRAGLIAALLVLDLCEVRDAPAPRSRASMRPRASLRPGRGKESRRPSARATESQPSDGLESNPAAPRPTDVADVPAAPLFPVIVAPARPQPPPTEAAPATRSAEDGAQRAAQLRDELERGRAAAARAGVASVPVAPKPTPQHKSRLTAEQAYEQGRRALAEGQLHVARRQLEAAAAEMPEAVEYRLAAAFCRWLIVEDGAEREAETLAVKTLLVEQMKADRRCALAYYVHGRLSLAADDVDAAARAFTNASRLDPKDREIQRWARHVGPPKKPVKKRA